MDHAFARFGNLFAFPSNVRAVLTQLLRLAVDLDADDLVNLFTTAFADGHRVPPEFSRLLSQTGGCWEGRVFLATLVSMQERSFSPGEVLAEKYRLVAPLGHGGMGVVWRADHLLLSSPVAIKLIHASSVGSEALRTRFLREAQSAAALRSPHVVQILDFGFHAETPFIVMELMEGESLSARLQRLGRLTPEDTVRVLTHVARAVDKAHSAGIVHRDLKPDNVFLVHNADEQIAKVLDFGIAKVAVTDAAPGTETREGSVLGSPHYMSPEQARGRPDVDFRSDLWSLGVIAFECLTGRRPFDGETLGDLVMKICAEPLPIPSSFAPVPPGFDVWFAHALTRDPAGRFQSAGELADALRALCPLALPSLPPPSMASMASAAYAEPPSMPTPMISTPAPRKQSGLLLPLLLGFVALGILGVTAIGAFVFWPRAAGTETEADEKRSTLSASAASPAAVPPQTQVATGESETNDGGASSAVKSASEEVRSAKQQAAEARAKAANARAQAAEARAKAAAARQKALESLGKK